MSKHARIESRKEEKVSCSFVEYVDGIGSAACIDQVSVDEFTRLRDGIDPTTLKFLLVKALKDGWMAEDVSIQQGALTVVAALQKAKIDRPTTVNKRALALPSAVWSLAMQYCTLGGQLVMYGVSRYFRHIVNLPTSWHNLVLPGCVRMDIRDVVQRLRRVCPLAVRNALHLTLRTRDADIATWETIAESLGFKLIDQPLARDKACGRVQHLTLASVPVSFVSTVLQNMKSLTDLTLTATSNISETKMANLRDVFQLLPFLHRFSAQNFLRVTHNSDTELLIPNQMRLLHLDNCLTPGAVIVPVDSELTSMWISASLPHYVSSLGNARNMQHLHLSNLCRSAQHLPELVNLHNLETVYLATLGDRNDSHPTTLNSLPVDLLSQLKTARSITISGFQISADHVRGLGDVLTNTKALRELYILNVPDRSVDSCDILDAIINKADRTQLRIITLPIASSRLTCGRTYDTTASIKPLLDLCEEHGDIMSMEINTLYDIFTQETRIAFYIPMAKLLCKNAMFVKRLVVDRSGAIIVQQRIVECLRSFDQDPTLATAGITTLVGALVAGAKKYACSMYLEDILFLCEYLMQEWILFLPNLGKSVDDLRTMVTKMSPTSTRLVKSLMQLFDKIASKPEELSKQAVAKWLYRIEIFAQLHDKVLDKHHKAKARVTDDDNKLKMALPDVPHVRPPMMLPRGDSKAYEHATSMSIGSLMQSGGVISSVVISPDLGQSRYRHMHLRGRMDRRPILVYDHAMMCALRSGCEIVFTTREAPVESLAECPTHNPKDTQRCACSVNEKFWNWPPPFPIEKQPVTIHADGRPWSSNQFDKGKDLFYPLVPDKTVSMLDRGENLNPWLYVTNKNKIKSKCVDNDHGDDVPSDDVPSDEDDEDDDH